ncbi:hypothetical protein [Breoghania sp.]|uniref:hypothetical protein n=1 Tax=Breoghania sp. TaxID=2065378 RepID=UPI002629C090|nr:hypothetical protein [Breoghania sp.]MDJ0929872.1 hypothetical protein [Breoghania sp.]
MMMALDALVPVLLVIATRYIVARLGLVTGDHWRGFEKIAYFVIFPCIIIRNLVLVDFGTLPYLQLGATLAGSILTMSAFLLAMRPLLQRWFVVSPARFTSVFQGAMR